MIVGAYVLHLYCECGFKACIARAEFSEPTKAKARKVARKHGWSFRNGKVYFQGHYTLSLIAKLPAPDRKA